MDYEPVLTEGTDNTVLELLDRVLNTGVVLVGDITITVADIELLYLRLQLMLSSAETARQAGWLTVGPHGDRVPHAPHEGGRHAERDEYGRTPHAPREEMASGGA
jgi:hypothetical protein